MKQEEREQLWAALEATGIKLCDKYDVDFDPIPGLIVACPHAEYFLHEAAHWLTLNLEHLDLRRLPKKLSSAVGERFAQLSKLSRESLEYDALYVEHLAGAELGMWLKGDRHVVVSAGAKASSRTLAYVHKEIGRRAYIDRQDDYNLKDAASALAAWFRRRE